MVYLAQLSAQLSDLMLTADVGVVAQMEAEKARPHNERYIYGLNTGLDDSTAIVTLNPKLAAWIHQAEFLEFDTTFKRVRDDFNEWKVVMWLARINRREFCIEFRLKDSMQLNVSP